jgi:hypothetical protein
LVASRFELTFAKRFAVLSDGNAFNEATLSSRALSSFPPKPARRLAGAD